MTEKHKWAKNVTHKPTGESAGAYAHENERGSDNLEKHARLAEMHQKHQKSLTPDRAIRSSMYGVKHGEA